MQGISVQNTRSLERTGQELFLMQACLNRSSAFSAGQLTFWSISHNDFFLPESSAILLCIRLDFQPPWHLSSQEIKKNLPKVVFLWNMTHHPLQPGQWLMALQAFGSWGSNQASTVGSTAFSGVSFGKFSFVILQPFSFKRSPNINLVNSQHFWQFLSSWLDHCPLLHWQAAFSSPWWASLQQAVHLQVVFLWPLGSPSSEEPCDANGGLGHSQLLDGFDSGNCAKRIINKEKSSDDFIHSLQILKDFIDQKRDEKMYKKVWSDISVYNTINREEIWRSRRWYTIQRRLLQISSLLMVLYTEISDQTFLYTFSSRFWSISIQ